jgi:hypothetical protein
MTLKDGTQGPMTSCHILISGDVVSVVWGATALKKIKTKYTWRCGNVYDEEGNVVITKSYLASGSGKEDDVKEGEEYLFSYRYHPEASVEDQIPLLGHMRSDPVSMQKQIIELLKQSKQQTDTSNKPDAGDGK